MKLKNLITVVTDSIYTATTIAESIGANERHEGYFLGNGYAVTWTNGDIIEATFKPSEKFVLSTNMESRLVYAHNYKLSMRNYDNLVGYKKSERDKAQLAVIRALWGMSRVVVNAMLPSASGEVSFLNLYYYLRIPVEVRRAWLSKLTNKCIRHGVNHGPADRKQYEKWLEETIFNKLVIDSREDAEFRGQLVVVELDAETYDRTVELKKEEETKPQGTCTEVCESPEETPVRLPELTVFSNGNLPLHNAHSLLVAGAVELGFTHEKTIQTAFMLYVKKLISYPLSTQNTIPVGMWKEMKENMAKLRHNTKWGKEIQSNRISRCHNFRNAENFYNGHGIVTTGLHPVDLSRDEEALYNLIVKRVIDALSLPPLKRRKKGARKWRKTNKPSKAAVSA